jgi:hypothetical protein
MPVIVPPAAPPVEPVQPAPSLDPTEWQALNRRAADEADLPPPPPPTGPLVPDRPVLSAATVPDRFLR